MTKRRQSLIVVVLLLTLAGACSGAPKSPNSPKGVASQEGNTRPTDGAEIGQGVEIAGFAGVSLRVEVDESAPGPAQNYKRISPLFRIHSERQPTSDVTVRLPLNEAVPAGTIPLMMRASSPNGPWEPLPTSATLISGKAQATTQHFSWFTTLAVPFSALLSEIKKIFDDATGRFLANAAQPTCSRESEARLNRSITSDSGDTVKWCLGMEGNDTVLRVVNGRRYPLQASHPGLTTIQSNKNYQSLSALSRYGSGNLEQLYPRDPVTFRVDGETASLRTEFNGVASGLFQLQVGVEGALSFLTRFGVNSESTAINIVDKLLSSYKCGANVANPAAGSIIATCFTPKQILDAFGAKAMFLAAFMVAGPIIEFFQSSFSAIGDRIWDRDVYGIRISRLNAPAAPGPVAAPNPLGAAPGTGLAPQPPPSASGKPRLSNFEVVVYENEPGRVGVAFDVGWDRGTDPVTCHFFIDGVERFTAQCGTHSSKQFYGLSPGRHIFYATVSDSRGFYSEPSPSVARDIPSAPAPPAPAAPPPSNAPPKPTIANFIVVVHGGGHVGVAFDVGWQSGRDPVTCHFFIDGVERFTAQCGTRSSKQFYGISQGQHSFYATVSDAQGVFSDPSPTITRQVT